MDIRLHVEHSGRIELVGGAHEREQDLRIMALRRLVADLEGRVVALEKPAPSPGPAVSFRMTFGAPRPITP